MLRAVNRHPILVFAALIVTNCSDSEMYRAKAKFACSQHGELYSLSGIGEALCYDGSTISSRIIEETVKTDPAYFPSNKE